MLQLSAKNLPTRRESLICLTLSAVYLVFVVVFIGLRPEHIGFMALFLGLFFVHSYTRKMAMCLLPFLIFAMSYDLMRIYPNYLVNPVDMQALHDADCAIFGVTVDGQAMTWNEYFAHHHCAFADFWSGIFYICWVPAPIAFGLYLFFSGRRGLLLRFAWAFLFINFIGFAGYYIHPACPPWYYAQCGGHFDESMLGHTIGSEAGLCRFDALIGMPLFHDIYSRNANVFAAIPSLHATYCLSAFLFALIGRCRWQITLPLAILSLGICWTAIYTSHHYIIDVLLGIGLCLVVVFVWEKLILPIRPVHNFYRRYEAYVS